MIRQRIPPRVAKKKFGWRENSFALSAQRHQRLMRPLHSPHDPLPRCWASTTRVFPSQIPTRPLPEQKQKNSLPNDASVFPPPLRECSAARGQGSKEGSALDGRAVAKDGPLRYVRLSACHLSSKLSAVGGAPYRDGALHSIKSGTDQDRPSRYA